MSYEQSFQWFYYVRLQEYQKVDITNGLRREKIHRLKRWRINILFQKIKECHEDPDINESFGYVRVKTWLKRNYGLVVNHKRVYRLMKENGIQAKIRVKRWKHFGRKEQFVISDNRLNREFTSQDPNRKWVTDITYLIFNGKRLYLSVIQDLYNNEVVSFKISERNDLNLVLDTVKKATKKER